jgi:hypothetical protein
MSRFEMGIFPILLPLVLAFFVAKQIFIQRVKIEPYAPNSMPVAFLTYLVVAWFLWRISFHFANENDSIYFILGLAETVLAILITLYLIVSMRRR